MTKGFETRFTSAHTARGLDLDRQASMQAHRRSFILPGVMIAGGWLVTMLHALIAEKTGLTGAMIITSVWLVMLVVSVVAGLLGLILACKLFGDDAGSIGLALTRLAGVCAATMAAALWFSPIVGCLHLFITLGIMSGLMAMMFRMDLRAGMVVAFITWIAWIAVSLGTA